MFCAPIAFLQHFENVKPKGCFAPPPTNIAVWGTQPPGLMFLKYCENFISVQNMLTYFRLHRLYIKQGGSCLSSQPLEKGPVICSDIQGQIILFVVCSV